MSVVFRKYGNNGMSFRVRVGDSFAIVVEEFRKVEG